MCVCVCAHRGAVVPWPSVSLRGDDGGATRGRRGAPHQEGAQIRRVDDRWVGQRALRRQLLLLLRLLPVRLLPVRLLPVRLLPVRLLPVWLLPVRLRLLHTLLWRRLVHLLHSLRHYHALLHHLRLHTRTAHLRGGTAVGWCWAGGQSLRAPADRRLGGFGPPPAPSPLPPETARR